MDKQYNLVVLKALDMEKGQNRYTITSKGFRENRNIKLKSSVINNGMGLIPNSAQDYF